MVILESFSLLVLKEYARNMSDSERIMVTVSGQIPSIQRLEIMLPLIDPLKQSERPHPLITELTVLHRVIISNHINKQLLISHKAGDPVRIGVCMSKTEWLMPSIWAIIRNGYTYMPIDPQTPMDRIQKMMRDSGGVILLTDGQHLDINEAECIVMQPSELKEIQPYDTIDQTDNNIAYIIYTSGTTGVPKGIPISYDNLVSLMDTISLKEVFGIRKESVLMLFASISFDTSIVPIFGSLYFGAQS